MDFDWDIPPPNIIEVSVFGRGSGECILIHYGDGKWAVIDSFKVDKRPIALLYLEAIGAVSQDCIELVAATHWHDDHIHGLAEVYGAAPNAKGVIPEAMLRDEFKAFASQFTGASLGSMSSGVSELKSILSEMQSRGWKGVELGRAWQKLLRYENATLSHGASIDFDAMSPSTFDVIQFLGVIAAFTEPENVAIRAPHYDRNDVSCAMHIGIGDNAIILGADLENVPHNQSGWKAVFSSQQCPSKKATLFKVSHHGSVTGHHDEIWNRLCVKEPVATLAPWARGGNRLPKREDVTRIRKLSGQSYTASATVMSGDRHRIAAVNSVLKRTKSKIRKVNLQLGHTRHRWIDGKWETHQFGAAAPLKNIAA